MPAPDANLPHRWSRWRLHRCSAGPRARWRLSLLSAEAPARIGSESHRHGRGPDYCCDTALKASFWQWSMKSWRESTSLPAAPVAVEVELLDEASPAALTAST